MNGAPLTRTPPRRSWGRGPSPPGWRRIQARRLTCLLLRAVQRRRVESLVLGALSSSPVHRALVLVLGTNIAVLLCCRSRLDSVTCYLYLYIPGRHSQKSHKNGGRACALLSTVVQVVLSFRDPHIRNYNYYPATCECNKGGRFPSSLVSPPFPRDQLMDLGRAPLALLGHELLELTGAA